MFDILMCDIANRKIKCSAGDALNTIRRLKTEYASMNSNTLDGMRLDWDDRWVLIRPSNTEPIIRITAEALSQKTAEALADTFEKKINT